MGEDMRRNALSFVLFLCACTTPVSKQTEELAYGPLLMIQDSRPDAPINGIWKSRGYGWILSVKNGTVIRYETGGFGCYPTPENVRGETPMLSIPFQAYRLSTDGNTATFMPIADAIGPTFDRLEHLPDECSAPLDTSPEYTLETFLTIFDEHYAHFDRRGINWPDLKSQTRARFNMGRTEDDLRAAMEMVIQNLQDSHTRFIVLSGSKPERIQYGQGETLPMIREGMGESSWLIGILGRLQSEILDTGSHHVGQTRIVWGTIDERVGYIQIFQMGGFTELDISDPGWAEAELLEADRLFDDAFSTFEGMDAVIIDLSNNRGGYDEIARRIAARFTAEPFLAYSVTAKDSGITYDKVITPPDGPVFTGPVYLLTSDVTVSGGEISTLALRQLPNVTHLGMATRGAFSTPLAKALPNGWVVELANETFAAPDGAIYTGTGIPPEIELEIFDPADPVTSHGNAIQHILEEIDRN